MKRIIILLLAIATWAPAFAQEEKTTVPEIPEPVTKKDTSEVILNGKKIIIISDETNKDETEDDRVVSTFGTRRSRVWQGFEIGFTGVSYTENFNTEIPAGSEFFDPHVGKSINWAINPFELDIRIVGEYVKFSTGLGYNVKNFDLQNNYRLQIDTSGVTSGYQDTTNTLARNRFRTGYITAPLMLYFNTSEDPNRAFRIGAGVVFGVKIFEAYRIKHYEDNHRTREKYNGGYNANPYMMDLRAVVGYGGVNFYATYSTQTLFNDAKGPVAYPFTFGIAFVNSY